MVRVQSIGVAPTVTLAQRPLPWWLRYAPSRIQYLDDFEGVLKWYQTTGTLTRDTSIDVFEGTYCAKLVTAGAAGDDASMTLNLGAVPRSRVALQFRWHVFNALDTTLRDFLFYFYLWDGAYQTKFGVRYLKNLAGPQNKWQYIDPGNNWTDIPGGSQFIPTALRIHNYLRVTMDFSLANLKYLEFEFNNLVLSNLGLAPYHSALPTSPYIWLSISQSAEAAAVSNAWVDALCLSDKEP